MDTRVRFLAEKCEKTPDQPYQSTKIFRENEASLPLFSERLV